MNQPNESPERFSEVQLREIISRAVNSETTDYTRTDIEEIGAQLGLSSHAIEAAITKLRPAGKVAGSAPGLSLLRYTAIGAVLGTICVAVLPGVVFRGFDGVSAFIYSSMLVLSGGLARMNTGLETRPLLNFIRRNFAMWGGFVIGGTTLARLTNPDWLGNYSGEIALIILTLWGLSSAVGGVLAASRGRPTDPDAPKAIREPWQARLAQRLKTWIDAVLTPFHVVSVAGRSHGHSRPGTEFNGV